MSKKIVLKVDIHCEKCKQKALKTVAGIQGVESMAIDVKEQKITVIGDSDPIRIAKKLRKSGFADLVSIEPAKEPEKPPEEKKKDPKPEPEPPVINVQLPSLCERCSGYWGWHVVEYEENPSTCSIL